MRNLLRSNTSDAFLALDFAQRRAFAGRSAPSQHPATADVSIAPPAGTTWTAVAQFPPFRDTSGPPTNRIVATRPPAYSDPKRSNGTVGICPRGTSHSAGTAALWMTRRLATWPAACATAGPTPGRRSTTPTWSASGGASRSLIGPNTADVADVVQETMIAAARSARGYDAAKGSLWLWLWGIARLQVALHFRKQQRHDRLKHTGDWLAASNGRLSRWLDGVDPTPADLLETAELAAIVRTTLANLPVDYESLLTAKYLDGESIAQIAGRERCTESAVHSKLARAREAFRQAFARIAGGDLTDAEACLERP